MHISKLGPRDVLKHIENAYPGLLDPQFHLRSEHGAKVASTLAMLDKIPPEEFGKLDGSERALYAIAEATLRSHVEQWKTVTARERAVGREPVLGRLGELGDRHPIEVVRRCLTTLATAPTADAASNPPRPPAGRPKAVAPSQPKAAKSRGAWGRWKNLAVLGEGGQSHTFVVEDQTGELAGKFVLKRLKNVTRKARFEREVAVALRLRHSNVLSIVDSDFAGEKPYLVSEYCEGGHLSWEVLQPLPLARVIEQFEQICQGLGAAHAAGIVHRDIKPDNIFVRSDGNLVVGDFGVCYLAEDERLTTTQEVHRNWLCVAPELEGGRLEEVVPSADVYCLGKLLYWMLTGRLLLREAQRQAEFTLLKREPRSAYAMLHALLDKMVVQDASRRLPTAGAVLAEVRELMRRMDVNAHEIDISAPQPCSYCARADYEVRCDPRWWLALEQNRKKIQETLDQHGIQRPIGRPWLILVCPSCGHMQVFQPAKATTWTPT